MQLILKGCLYAFKVLVNLILSQFMMIDWAAGFFFIAGDVELGLIIEDINFISKRWFAVLRVLVEFFEFIFVV